ncbi:hypothetical protein [Prosthecobacter vanneervenii]|uniref:Uncharacterized protein n=1 Tax=Prosthecobacter vanneervenii TaxID=48466 RepID=A0A7W8DLE7_9BACT|nr:hypothetical protein [Prosthecobacter vanneervenii]MBB5034324.1 hypothetical protein [Prosthecobacter vanneervenii]
MDEAKRSQRLIIVLVVVLLGISISTALQVFVLQQDTPQFYSSAALDAVLAEPLSVSASASENRLQDCFNMVMDELESEEMQSRAVSSLLVTSPSLTMCPVKLEGWHFKNSTVIYVGAQGSQSAYTTAFLDALMDEFAAFSKLSEEPVSQKRGAYAVLKRASPAVRILDDWLEPAVSGVITGGISGLLAGLLLAFILIRPERASHSITTSDSAEALGMKSIPRQIQSSWSHRRHPLVWGVSAGVLLGLSVQIIQLASMPAEFRSLAKLQAVSKTSNGPVPDSSGNIKDYGQIIRDLESREMALRAMRRVKKLMPEAKERDVDIRVAMTRGSAVFNVLATSDEPQYTRIFLNALLDEFIIAGMKADNRQVKDAIVLDRATPASENIVEWTVPLLTGVFFGAWVGIIFGIIAKWLGQ